MAASFFEGRRRSGKSKFAVAKIQEYLNEGRTVATNLDLFLENLCPDNKKVSVIRIPDFPRSQDLFGLGSAYPELNEDDPDTYDENKNGLVVIDELLTSFNSRSWSDKDRLNVINWIVLSGKRGWDLIFIGQSYEAVDAQIRDTVVDRIVSCRSNENLYPGIIWNSFIKPIYMRIYGKGHFAFFYDGKTKCKTNFIYRIKFKRDDLHSCYKTGQIFKKDVRLTQDAKGKLLEIEDRTTYTSIGKNYFDVPKTGMIALKSKKRLPKFNFKKFKLNLDFKFAAVTFLAFLFAFLYLTKPATVTETIIKEVKVHAPPKPIKKELDSLNDVRVALSTSDLGILYINCLSYVSDGNFTYCFENDNSEVVHPEFIGYKVLYVNECHAKLVRGAFNYDVYCNPVRKREDAPKNIYQNEQQQSNQQLAGIFDQ